MIKKYKSATQLYKDVPPGWYFESIKENALQRFWHERRFKEIKKLASPVKGRVLDIGCADGVFTKVILENTKAKKIIGIDVSKNSIEWAKKHWKKNKKMQFLIADAHRLPFKTSIFDAVFSLEMLEHIHNPKKVIAEIKRVLKKRGYVVLLVPTESLLFRLVWFLWQFSGRMVWKDTHIQSYRNNGLLDLVKKGGFRIDVSKKFLLGMLHAVKARK